MPSPLERPAPTPESDRWSWHGWMLHQRALIEKLRAPENAIKASWQTRSQTAALRLEHCGELWLERKSPAGFEWDVARCRSRWCPSCQNVWRSKILDLYNRAIEPGDRVTLVTLTGGPKVYPGQLAERLRDMSRALRRWRRKVGGDILGGVYCWEVTDGARNEGEGDRRLHLHLHLAVVLADSWWLRADDAAIDNSARQGQTMPALGWLAVTWAEAIQHEAPGMYADLPTWRKLLPSMLPFIEKYFPEYWNGEPTIARGASVDIGGRWPDPSRQGEPLQRLGGAGAREALEQCVKYVVKPGAEELEVGTWREIFYAFAGRRRIQPFGCLFGVKPPPEADEDAPEEAALLTGEAALVGSGAKPYSYDQASQVLGAFLYGAEAVRMEQGRNDSIRWLKYRHGEEGRQR